MPFSMADQTAAAPAAAASAPSGGQSITPTPNPSAEGLLRQADSLTEKLLDTQKQLQAAQAKAAQEAEERRKSEAARVEAESRWKQYSDNYAKSNASRAEAYIKHIEDKGITLDDATKAMYVGTFTKPEHEAHASRFWNEMQADIKVAASRKAQDEKLAAMEAEQKRLQEQLLAANNAMAKGLRSNYVDALTAATPGPETINVAASAAGSSGSGRPALPAGHVLVQAPSVPELPFLKEAGISGGFSVTASNAMTGEAELRAMQSSVLAAPSHGLMFDSLTKEANFPYSMRHVHPALFGWLTNESGLIHADVSHLTHVTNSKLPGFQNEEQRVDTGFSSLTAAPVGK